IVQILRDWECFVSTPKVTANGSFGFNGFILCLFWIFAFAEESHGDPSAVLVTELKTEHLSEPLGIQTPRPRFRWLLDSKERGQLQTAYQILVATSLEKLQADTGDKWDSGRVRSDNSIEVS